MELYLVRDVNVVWCTLCGVLCVLWESCGVFMWMPSGHFVVVCVGPFWFMFFMSLVSVLCAIVCGLCHMCLCVLVFVLSRCML